MAVSLKVLRDVEKALAEAEHTIECEWGRLQSRDEWEHSEQHGPSDELKALRVGIAQIETEMGEAAKRRRGKVEKRRAERLAVKVS